MMLNEIIEAINGNVKFCLRNSKTFFVSKCSVNGNIIKFTDAVDGIECEEILDNTELMTFASNTIPYMSDLSDIKSFLKINADDHIQNNLIFDDFVRKCVSYMKLFNDQSVNKIKEAVIDNNTSNLDKLVIIECEHIIDLDNCAQAEVKVIKATYKKLVDTKLNEALHTLNQFIADVDDKEFELEANNIKKDLSDNANDYMQSIINIPFEDLFDTWPTLLNPSPFNLNKKRVGNHKSNQ
mgnify:FL=1